MAEGDGTIPNNAKEFLMLGDLHLDTDTIYMALVHTKTPDTAGAAGWATISACEASGAGYTAGGSPLGGKSVTQDDTDNCARWDATDVTWSSLSLSTPGTGTPGHAVAWAHTTGSPIVAWWELGSTTTNGGDYTLQFSASGLIQLD